MEDMEDVNLGDGREAASGSGESDLEGLAVSSDTTTGAGDVDDISENERLPTLNMDGLAAQAAADAFENRFHFHRGQYPYDDFIIHYNNNPYQVGPERRDDELKRIREWLALNKIEELGFATYPTEGTDKGYSFAMVLDSDDEELISEAFTAMYIETFKGV